MIPLPLTLRGDISRFNAGMASYARELGLAPSEVVKRQAGLLISELAEKANPPSRQEMDKSIQTDVGRVYSVLPRQMIPESHRRGTMESNLLWLMAGPNFLIGANENDFRPDADVESVKAEFRKASRRAGPRQVRLGSHGKQAVYQRNRILVRRGVLRGLVSALKKRVGTLGGSWAIAWPVLRSTGRKPASFKYRHVEDGTARGTYIDGLGVPGKATFTIINNATGVESGKSLAMVHEALAHRTIMMDADLRNQLRGAYRKAFDR